MIIINKKHFLNFEVNKVIIIKLKKMRAISTKKNGFGNSTE